MLTLLVMLNWAFSEGKARRQPFAFGKPVDSASIRKGWTLNQVQGDRAAVGVKSIISFVLVISELLPFGGLLDTIAA